MKLKNIILFLYLALSFEAFACYVPPNTLMEADAKLVKRTPVIVLATVTEQKNNEFSFKSIKSFKGKAQNTFTLNGYNIKENEYRQTTDDFNGHDSKMWKEGFTNSVMPGDCEAYGYFEQEKTYLIFLVKPTHVRAYENILSENDLWLKKVKLLIENNNE